MEAASQPIKPSALNDWAYQVVRERILNLEYAPASQLHVERLADELRVSRTPVREAMLRLEQDGLVRSVPRVGFFVTEITQADLEELFEIRTLLESYTARKSALLLTDGDLARLRSLIERGSSAAMNGDLADYLDADGDFHNLLIERAQNQRLNTLLSSLHNLLHRQRKLSVRSPENVRLTDIEHRNLLEALIRRDAERAGQLMAKHLSGVGERMVELLHTSWKADLAQNESSPSERELS